MNKCDAHLSLNFKRHGHIVYALMRPLSVLRPFPLGPRSQYDQRLLNGHMGSGPLPGGAVKLAGMLKQSVR